MRPPRDFDAGQSNADGPPPDDFPEDQFPEDPDFDPDRLAVCAYWRCGELFETKSATHRYCRKACRSRQNKWQRSQERKVAKTQAKRLAALKRR
ncbi:MAG: hypothetical protein ACI8Y4_004483 [Candidatus Poriferisodalaceae bacterium]|jgi:hypothetical protein